VVTLLVARVYFSGVEVLVVAVLPAVLAEEAVAGLEASAEVVLVAAEREAAGKIYV
jgi:hypothetical protein